MSKITRKQVIEAHGKYGDDLAKWGEDNLQTQRSFQRYWDMRTQFEAAGGVYRR